MNPKQFLEIRKTETVEITGKEPPSPRIPYSASEILQEAHRIASFYQNPDPAPYFSFALNLLEAADAFKQKEEDKRRTADWKRILQNASQGPPEQAYSVASLEQLGFKQVTFEWLLTPIAKPKGKAKKPVVRLGSITQESSLRDAIWKALPQEAEKIIHEKRINLQQLEILDAFTSRKVSERNQRVARGIKKPKV